MSITSEKSDRNHSGGPIFILGISQRSGTNFLSNLIRKHPACGAPKTIWEDYLVSYSDFLKLYTDSVYKRWKWRSGRADPSFEVALRKSIGDGMIQFLSSGIQGERLVTKTPEVRQIDNFFDFFPDARLLILVRDGRAVVESRVKTFGESYQAAMQKWSLAADTIRRFQETHSGRPEDYLIVKYEDLWSDVERELRRIFDFCELPADVYDFDEAANLPIRGSSVHHGEQRSDIHWEPVKKTNDFDPTERWSHWGRSLHEQFNAIAGDRMAGLDYEIKRFVDNRFRWKLLGTVLNLRNNTLFLAQTPVSGMKQFLKSMLGEQKMSSVRRHLPSEKTRK